MLKRLYVDNYKCLVNFECSFGGEHILIGENGSGKSTVFEVLHLLRRFIVEGAPVAELFPTQSQTRWQARDIQTYELAFEESGGTYLYRLEVAHVRESRACRVSAERLTLNGKPLYSAQKEESQIYLDDHSEGPKVSLGWRRSGLSLLGDRHDNNKMTEFKNRMSRVLVVRPNPFQMQKTSEVEVDEVDLFASNFVSWYRGLLALESLSRVSALNDAMQEVLPGFQELRLVKWGERVRVLSAIFQFEGGKEDIIMFDELSEGQRLLIVLYTLLYFRGEGGYTLCLDEPDNFISLPEVQPWLNELSDRVLHKGLQSLMISHHPESLNFLARDAGLVFERAGAGPTRMRPFTADPTQLLTPAELLSRGWENEHAEG